MTELCLLLLAPRALEEKLLDFLLSTPGLGACVSQPASRFGLDPALLNPREQVLGQGDALLAQVFVDAPQRDSLIAELREHFRGSGLRYWLLPVVARGEC